MSAAARVAGLIPAGELQRRKAEHEALHGARQRAQALLETAEQECGRLRQQACEAGLAEGRSQALTHQLETARQLALLRTAAQEQMVDVVSQALHHVLAGPARETFFAGFIEEAQQLLGRMSFARLRVHPADEALVRALARHSILGRTDTPVSIESDPALSPGACALVSDVGKVSVSLQARLDDVKAVLSTVLAQQDAVPQDLGHADA